MNIDQYGRITLSEKDIFDALYEGKIQSFEHLFLDDSALIEQFNQAVELNADNFFKLAPLKDLSISKDEFDQQNQKNWFMPEEYHTLDIEQWLINQCTNSNEHIRVAKELQLFRQNKMINVLKYLKYLVDTMRKNNIVWGVGRGSSVASYCLYLIGVHKVDSIKYELDIKEFLK